MVVRAAESPMELSTMARPDPGLLVRSNGVNGSKEYDNAFHKITATGIPRKIYLCIVK